MVCLAGTWYLPPAKRMGPLLSGKGSMLKPGAAAERRRVSRTIPAQ